MTPLPAPASTLALTTAAITLGYAWVCLINPFRACRRCRRPRHEHRHLGPVPAYGRAARAAGRRRGCTGCRHTGLRLRAGRALWNHLVRLHHDTRR